MPSRRHLWQLLAARRDRKRDRRDHRDHDCHQHHTTKRHLKRDHHR